jgi:metallo-beta-lactamase family protein
MILVEYENTKILLDCGLYQSNRLLEDYKVNSRKFNFDPKDIDYIFISHVNIDHFGLLPKIYKEGCQAEIITYYDSVDFIKPMLEDSAFIMERDMVAINKKHPNLPPVYSIEDISETLKHIRGYNIDVLYKLNDTVSFELKGAGHIIGSTQIVLYIKEASGYVHKIAYSGDIGNTLFDNPFIDKFEPINKCNVFIGETTYSDSKRIASKHDRDKDIEKLRTVIDTVCNDRHGRILIPCFALQRIQTMLKVLYDIYGNDENFNIPIVIDSPLAVKLTNVFKETLIGEQKELIDKITSWKNLKMISDAEDSKVCVLDKTPKIILASSGMVNNGRSVHYLKDMLPRSNDCIVFCGFMCEGTIGWKIKNEVKQKTITIDGKVYPNKCQVMNLKSFSSHMQYEQLLNYYKSINCDRLYLVHGDAKTKGEFKKVLEEELSKMNKTTKIIAVNKLTKANL